MDEKCAPTIGWSTKTADTATRQNLGGKPSVRESVTGENSSHEKVHHHKQTNSSSDALLYKADAAADGRIEGVRTRIRNEIQRATQTPQQRIISTPSLSSDRS
jgi:hypothetical protein